MARAVLPRASARQVWLLAGRIDRDDCRTERAAPLEEDPEFQEEADGTEGDGNEDAMD